MKKILMALLSVSLLTGNAVSAFAAANGTEDLPVDKAVEGAGNFMIVGELAPFVTADSLDVMPVNETVESLEDYTVVDDVSSYAFEDTGEPGGWGNPIQTMKKSNIFSNAVLSSVASGATNLAFVFVPGGKVVVVAGIVAGALVNVATNAFLSTEYYQIDVYYNSTSKVYTTRNEIYTNGYYTTPVKGSKGTLLRYRMVNGNPSIIDKYAYVII